MKLPSCILSPTAILGYGFPLSSFQAGLSHEPNAIAVDAGSTDPGPYYLGAGLPFTDRIAVQRDLAEILSAADERKIPVLIGSAGGSGGEPHLQRDLDLIRSLAKERGLRLRLAVIHAEIDEELVRAALREGTVVGAGPVPALTEHDLDVTERIVGQMGLEPFLEALDGEADVVLAGRAYDPAVFAAVPVRAGFDRGPAIHMGKILECGAIAATPGSGSDALIGQVGDGWFEVEALSEGRRCTTTSVAAHTLYEKSNPLILPGPGGHLDLTHAEFDQVTDRRVRVSGSTFVPSDGYFIKLEGTTRIGYRTISIAGCRDPIMIGQIDPIIRAVRERIADNFSSMASSYSLNFRLYGRDGVMGVLEPERSSASHELGIVIEAVAESQELAKTICSFARSTMLHCGYEGRVATAGNLAFPFSPSDFDTGEVFGFSVYHLLKVQSPTELFPIEYLDLR